MKRVHLVFAILALIIIAGCSGQTPTPAKDTFCGGIDGIEMQFIEGSPPSEVFDNNQFPFDVSLRLLNKGEHTVNINDARIELSGISSAEFGGPSYTKVVSERIIGKHKDQNGNCVDGDPVLVTFGGPGEQPFKHKFSLPGNTPYPLRADLCYKYSTNSTVQFCVQKELPRFGQEPTCKVSEEKKVSNSGSPIHLENFKQNPGGERKIAFAFDIVHKGTGAIHSGELCDTSFQNRNKVHVKVTSRVGSISCSSLNGGNEGDVMVIENKRVINCIMDTSAAGNEREFETPVNIELSFNYKQHVNADILVKHLS